MKKSKIILLSLFCLILAGLLFYSGTFFPQSRELKFQPTEKTNLIKGWWMFSQGKLAEIGNNYLVITSEDGKETLKVETLADTDYREQESSQEGIVQESLFKTIKREDLKVGNAIFLTTNIITDKLLTIRVSKILPQGSLQETE